LRNKAWLLAAIGAVAFSLRLLYISQLDGSPLLSVLMGDARVYDEWAMRIAGGEWMGSCAGREAHGFLPRSPPV
jgi:hypothetical protein